MRPRFTLASLLVLTMLCGVGFAVLRHATPLTASLVFTGTVLVLGVVVLGAILWRGSRRASCVGAAIFGIGYLVLASSPAQDRLVTTLLLDRLQEKLHPDLDDRVAIWDTTTGRAVRSVAFSPDGRMIGHGRDGMVRVWGATDADAEDFRCVGHSWFSLVAALVGGIIARLFHDRNLPLLPESFPDGRI